MVLLLQPNNTFTFSPHFPSSTHSLPNFNFNCKLKPSPLSLTLTRRLHRHPQIVACTVEEKNQPTSKPDPESEPEPEPEPIDSDLASELKKAMQERKEKEDDSFWNGVVKEIGEIEWPEFGKVLGTTGVVLSVIFGSSVVLLTVNAILAEISDKLFVGKGIQDFFS